MSARPAVRVHVASANTRRVTDLCIRSIRRFAGYPFELVVGDCGSIDGSIEMLRRYEDAGWLRLDVSRGWPLHHDWIDKWVRSCAARYAVFVDSDVEFRGRGWLADLVATTRNTGAALITAEFGPEVKNFVHPVTGELMRQAARPQLWVLLLDIDQVRDVRTSFAAVLEERKDLPEGRITYDTGALYFSELQRRGLAWAAMPPSFLRKARHFGGLSWKPLSGLASDWKTDLSIRARLLAYRTIWRRGPRKEA